MIVKLLIRCDCPLNHCYSTFGTRKCPAAASGASASASFWPSEGVGSIVASGIRRFAFRRQSTQRRLDVAGRDFFQLFDVGNDVGHLRRENLQLFRRDFHVRQLRNLFNVSFGDWHRSISDFGFQISDSDLKFEISDFNCSQISNFRSRRFGLQKIDLLTLFYAADTTRRCSQKCTSQVDIFNSSGNTNQFRGNFAFNFSSSQTHAPHPAAKPTVLGSTRNSIDFTISWPST